MRFAWVLAGVLSMTSAVAAEIYRWTDAEGRVHFGERPPPEGAERLALPQGAAPADADPDTAQRLARQRRMLEALDHERDRRETAKAQDAARRAADAGRCRQLQAYWKRLDHGGPLYYRRDDGGRDYLTEAQRQQEKARVQPQYTQACGRPP